MLKDKKCNVVKKKKVIFGNYLTSPYIEGWSHSEGDYKLNLINRVEVIPPPSDKESPTTISLYPFYTRVEVHTEFSVDKAIFGDDKRGERHQRLFFRKSRRLPNQDNYENVLKRKILDITTKTSL